MFLDDPPYFLPHGNSTFFDDAPLYRDGISPQQNEQQSTLYRQTSDVGDYRSVIDDLTIENQKLKQKLRKYSKPPTAHLAKDKLFEVKIHALSAQKRRELEEILRTFALDIVTTAIAKPTPPALAAHNVCAKHAAKSTARRFSSQPADSAYASMSHSGNNSASAPDSADVQEETVWNQAGKDRSIHSFLDGMPRRLQSKYSSEMPERQRKKLVVQRLEQLFTGRDRGLTGSHNQPIQQQEVSQSAARADRENDKSILAEGGREAHMLPSVLGSEDKTTVNTDRITVSDESGDATPETLSSDQRPTRPLDLDPERAQNPSDNIKYMRHLGMSTPNFEADTSSDCAVAADSEGWIYLNLLVGMAQLHTYNVTQDFVRSALADVSDRFQVSCDGQKVRWKGGTQGTRLSSEDDVTTPEDSDDLDERSKKRRKMDVQQSTPVHASEPLQVQNTTATLQHYKPLFKHEEASDSVASSEMMDSASSHTSQHDLRRDSSSNPSQARAGKRSRSSLSRRHDSGTLEYYSGAQFYTDLSGDRERNSPSVYSASTDGHVPRDSAPPFSRTPSGSLLPFRPFKDFSIADTGDSGRAEGGKSDLGGCAEDVLSINGSSSSTSAPLLLQNLLSTGLGGTQPADHFVVKVQTHRIPGHGHNATGLSGRKKTGHVMMQHSLASFFAREAENDDVSAPAYASNAEDLPVRTMFLSTTLETLQPSALPPPLAYHTSCSTSYGDSDDSEA